METKIRSSDNAASESWAKNVNCWQTASGPQCLRVETSSSEIHLFPYGYFQHAKLSREGNKDVLQIRFQDQVVIIKGKNLEPLCASFERLAVERIKTQPEKFQMLATTEGTIEQIEIKKISEKEPEASDGKSDTAI
ncbi:MAG: hypothetical protein ACREFE_13770 [Limisphaerales bacterium]